MNTDMKSEISAIISEKIRLTGLHVILDTFLTDRNPRVGFPFNLMHEEVLKLFTVESHLAKQMTEIMVGMSCTRKNITIHEMLCYIIDAFESLINTQTLVDHSKEGSELLLDYVHDTEKGPQLLRLATWV